MPNIEITGPNKKGVPLYEGEVHVYSFVYDESVFAKGWVSALYNDSRKVKISEIPGDVEKTSDGCYSEDNSMKIYYGPKGGASWPCNLEDGKTYFINITPAEKENGNFFYKLKGKGGGY